MTDISVYIIPAAISVGISLLASAINRCKMQSQIQVLETQIQQLQQQPPLQYTIPISPPQQQYMMPPPYAPGPQVMTI